ncbi:MAG: hypothetical protein ACOC2W_01120 [bacterium]
MLQIRKSVMSYTYYFRYNDKKETPLDTEIAELINWTLDEYRKFMLDNYKCIINKKLNQLRFIDRKDAQKACDFINSRIVLDVLSINN